MNNNEYIRLVGEIISREDMPEAAKLAYLQMLDILKKSKPEDLRHYEDSAYTIKGKKLSDEDRINYEINRIHKSIIEESSVTDEDPETLELTLKSVAFRNAQPQKTPSEKQSIKQAITRIQISQGLAPRFYTAFQGVVAQLVAKEEKEAGETYRTFQK